MKVIVSIIIVIAVVVVGSPHKPLHCTDPNTNTPIDCSLVEGGK